MLNWNDYIRDGATQRPDVNHETKKVNKKLKEIIQKHVRARIRTHIHN